MEDPIKTSDGGTITVHIGPPYTYQTYFETEGDLISLAKSGNFDVICHGCNCQNLMGAGIAPQMAKAFGCDKFPLEGFKYKGDMTKLGNIDYSTVNVGNKILTVVNCYTQYGYGYSNTGKPPLDYEALTLCMRKINFKFQGQHIGLPYIGCGLAGGKIEKVLEIIKTELCDMIVTMVKYNK